MSESISEIVAAAEGLSIESAEQQAVAESSHLQIQRRISELADRIKAGETTGDAVNDFVIAHHRMLPSFHPRVVEMYRQLDARLKSHPGEFILLVERSEQDLYHTIVHDDSVPRHVVEKITLGLLSEPSGLLLNHQSGQISFSTSRYTEEGDLKEGWLAISQDIPTMLNQGIPDSSHLGWAGGRRREIALEIHIGDKEVEDWIKNHPMSFRLSLVWHMTWRLNRPLDSPELREWLTQQRERATAALIPVLREVSELRQKAKSLLESHREEIERLGLDFENTIKSLASEHDLDL